MRILFLSFFFEPDLSACSFRAAAIVNAMQEQLSENDSIELITTMPNRYSTFKESASEHEQAENLTIHRLRVPDHKSGMAGQARAYASYFRGVRKIVSNQQYDLVFVTSGRFFSAFLGSIIAKEMKCPLYLDIRDIFVDTLKDVLPKYIYLPLLLPLKLLERIAFNRASKINLISKGFDLYFSEAYKNKSFDYFTNGIDTEFLQAFKKDDIACGSLTDKKGLVRIVYAGNFGECQGLHQIVPQLAKQLEGKAEFRIIGDGGRRQQLEDALVQNNLANVTIVTPVPRKELVEEYQQADILFMHLNDYDAVLKVLPSKLFEYGATGKLILAGVSGYPAKFLKQNLPWARFFYPCDVDAAVLCFESLEQVHVDSEDVEDFKRKYSRKTISTQMVKSILGLVKS